MRTTTRQVRLVSGAICCLLALALVACGSTPTTTAPVAPTTAAAAALGPVQRAEGAPVAIGFLGISQTDDPSEPTLAATAVASYANTYLGGLAGHQIRVVSCEDKATPAGAAACGDRFVQENVVAVAVGTSGQVDGALPALRAAGIPLVVNLAGTEALLRTPGVFLLRNPLSLFGTAAGYARDRKLASVTVITPDLAVAAAPARALAPPLFANANSAASVLAVALDARDMVAQVELAERGRPAMYLVVGDPGFCAAAITAIRGAGSSAEVVSADACIGEDGGAAIPGGLDGVTVIAQAVLDPATQEAALFDAVLSVYGQGVGTGAQSIGGYQAMLSVIRAVNASRPAEVGPAAITSAISQAPATPYPLGGGATFACNGQAAAQISPNICSAIGFVAAAGTDGTLSDYRPINTDGLYQLR